MSLFYQLLDLDHKIDSAIMHQIKNADEPFFIDFDDIQLHVAVRDLLKEKFDIK